ncbi:epoxide hydrolase [Myriangium duriaei CBS 260.36]|uniref:Epoxide hydrolase n=1 Tax=Myriangium duriaei CBS 260.36 TaxID=1168546 RepID=A0A9P4MKD8_9PEZI|nr:epoxide hydrolase [Myriangium duriaei CBS 260.36]
MSPKKKLSPTDAKALTKTAVLNGTKYSYILSQPDNGHFKATIFLVHGWPDCSFGWRYQIPLLTSLGLRVVVPDMTGYGGTDAPKVPPHDIHLYGFKKAADDFAALARLLEAPKIILGGHDWGGMVVYRVAQWYPELISHIFTVCTPYAKPSDVFYPTEALVKGPYPQFGYQLQLGGPDVESSIQTKDDIEQFLHGIYAGKVPAGKVFMTPEKGVDLSLIGSVQKSPLLEDEEMQYIVEKYSRNGMHGPLNWYRTREANFKDERKLTHRKMDHPVLFILANKDNILTREYAAGMERDVPNLTRREVTAGHWALWQASDEVNQHVQEWLEMVVFGGRSAL